MCYLVAQYSGLLSLAIQLVQLNAIKRDFAARHGPRVGNRVIEHNKFVREFWSVRNFSKTISYALYVSGEFGVDNVIVALRLARRRVVFFAYGDSFFFRDKLEFFFWVTGLMPQAVKVNLINTAIKRDEYFFTIMLSIEQT